MSGKFFRFTALGRCLILRQRGPALLARLLCRVHSALRLTLGLGTRLFRFLRGKAALLRRLPRRDTLLLRLGAQRYKVDRSKGLGENDPEMMWLTTMNPETRRLIKVMPEDAEATAQVFDLLLGDNLQGRKDHIAENGYKYLELADIS